MNLPDPLPVRPWTQPCKGQLLLPGSKSLTNRALVLAALAQGAVELRDALFSRDTAILIHALQALGFAVAADADGRCIRVAGAGGRIPNASARIHVGNAGTAARFLTALVCLHPQGSFEFDGDVEMRSRPMLGLIDALTAVGARFHFAAQPGCFPFRVETAGLQGGEWHVDATTSSQMLSALMMVAPFASSAVTLRATGARPAFVAMTRTLMGDFGYHLRGDAERGFTFQPDHAANRAAHLYAVEPDVSAASYFIALPRVTGGELFIHGLRDSMLQGDLAFVDVMRAFGLQITKQSDGWTFAYPDRPPAPGPHAPPLIFDFQAFSDTFLTLAAVAPLLQRPVRIDGIAHTRLQECNRPDAVATELQRMGFTACQTDASLTVYPRTDDFLPAQPVTVQTYHDHRVAMAFAILGCANLCHDGTPWVRIADPACCGKTFPGFFPVLEKLYQQAHDI